LSGAAIAAYGPGAAYLLSALFLAVITVLVIATRERPGERLLPWSKGQATASNVAIQAGRWAPILKRTFKSVFRPVSLFYVPVVLIKGMHGGLMLGAMPLIATGSAGWTEADVTAVAGVSQLVAGVAGMTIGGLVGDRLGAKWTTILFFGGWLALNATMLLAQPLWSESPFVTAYVITWFSLDTLVTVAALPIAMRLCNRTVAATQFTLYMALNNFGISMGAAVLGVADKVGGLATLFGIMAVTDVVAIAIMLAVRFPTRQVDQDVADQLPLGEALVPARN